MADILSASVPYRLEEKASRWVPLFGLGEVICFFLSCGLRWHKESRAKLSDFWRKILSGWTLHRKVFQ